MHLGTVLREYGPLAGTVGLVLYGLLRLAYVFFYLQLRTTPEEVGYSYSRLLSESIAGAVELMLLCGTVVALLTVLYRVARIAVRRLTGRWGRRGGSDSLRDRRGSTVRRIAVSSLAAGAAIVFLSLPALAWWNGRLAQGGQLVRNVYFVGVPYLPVLAVQAVPADVAWKDGDKDKPLPLSGRRCLMYLGRADGITVFYDVRTRESVRLPTGDVTVTLRYACRVPDYCR